MLRVVLTSVIGVCLCRALPAAPKPMLPATPSYRVPLAKLGFRPATSAILQREAYAMNTVDFIDDEHVLLTFNARKLVPRMPEEDREGEQARLIHAVVLHLPDGKVVHEAEWRTRDHNRYLWPLQHGRFLFRVRNELYIVRPLHGLERRLLLDARGDIEALQVSPSGDVLLVQTAPERHIGDDPTVPLESSISAAFYRIGDDEHPTVHLQATLKSEKPFFTPFTSRGFLTSSREDREHWGFDFHPFVGKPIELAGLLSTCQPHAEFLGETTFLATGCRGGDDRRLLAGFDLNAEANWVFTTDDAPVWQSFASAAASGRFALRTTSLVSPAEPGEHVSLDEVRGQLVHVFNFRGGVEMLRAVSHPVQHAGQTFSLSSDGLKLAVLHDTDLDIYNLPPVTDADRKAVDHEEQALKAIDAGSLNEMHMPPQLQRQP